MNIVDKPARLTIRVLLFLFLLKLKLKIRKKSIFPKFEAVNESPFIFEGVFRHFFVRHTGQEEGEKTGHLVKRVAMILQRGLAGMLLNRIPGHPLAVIDGQE